VRLKIRIELLSDRDRLAFEASYTEKVSNAAQAAVLFSELGRRIGDRVEENKRKRKPKAPAPVDVDPAAHDPAFPSDYPGYIPPPPPSPEDDVPF
jgi:hypothetical protein